MNLAYGVEPQTIDHPYIVLSEDTMAAVDAAALPGAFLVDFFPLCELAATISLIFLNKNVSVVKHVPAWMPGAGFKSKAKEWNKVVIACLEEPFGFVQDQLVSPR